jgi:nucleoside 2-deoxyribosyltransferase
LFNEKEREEMSNLASVLEKAGFATFLPQRDGLHLTLCAAELLKIGVPQNEATAAVARAIFALDIYQLLVECDAIIVNLNGRVPDEGAVSEAAIAWSSGKIVVGYKADDRSVFLGNDNPLVTGLFDFNVCRDYAAIVRALQDAAGDCATRKQQRMLRNGQVSTYLSIGKEIWAALKGDRRMDRVAATLARQRNEPGKAQAAC